MSDRHITTDLFSAARHHIGWRWRVARELLATRPAVTMVATGALIATHFARMLAFFLPLKVLLLIGTPGVPRYFQTFVAPEHRTLWIVALAIATVLLYAASLTLARLAGGTIERSAKRISDGLHGIKGNPDKIARRVRQDYALLTRNHADIGVVLIGVVALAVINVRVLVCLLVVAGALALLSRWLLRHQTATGLRGWARGWMLDDHDVYLQALSAVGFLSLFVVLVVDFLLSPGRSLIVAILVLILGRLTFDCLGRAVAQAVQLEGRHEDVERLVSATPGAGVATDSLE